MSRRFRVAFFAQTLIILILGSLFVFESLESEPEPSGVTHFYELETRHLNGGLNSPWVAAVGGEQYLALSADSNLGGAGSQVQSTTDSTHEVFFGDANDGEPRRLARIQLPMDSGLSHRTLDFLAFKGDSPSPGFDTFVSYVTADEDSKCRQLSVAMFQIPKASSELEQTLSGEVLFRTACIPFAPSGDSRLQESGGRLVVFPRSEWRAANEPKFLLTVGDFGNLKTLAPNLDSKLFEQLGSILEISGESWRVLASGLRNPQGLAIADLHGVGTSILETEHGPRGGDELNLIVDAADYGWPANSAGTSYGPADPESAAIVQGFHLQGVAPLHSWLPSIAPSQLLQVTGSEFSEWWTQPGPTGRIGDILIGSLKAESLFRVRVLNGAVHYVEQIPLGERIRNLVQLESGRIVIGTDDGELLLVSAERSWDTESSNFK